MNKFVDKASAWDAIAEKDAEIARLREALENALACLRHTHDRLIEYPELETLRITINAECRAIKAAIST